MKEKVRLNINYGIIQGLYWAVACLIGGFMSVYLLDRGFSNLEVGSILAISNALSLFFQPLLAVFLERHLKVTLTKMINILLAIILISSIVLVIGIEKTSMVTLLVIILLTIVSILHPFINSLSFFYESKGLFINFGISRAVGSIAYAIVSFVLGSTIDKYGTNILPSSYALAILMLIFFIFVYGLANRGPSTFQKLNGDDKSVSMGILQFILTYKKFIFFLLGLVLIFFDNGVINFFIIHIAKEVGGATKEVGIALAIAAVVELPAMVSFHKINKKVSSSTLLKLSLIMYSVKHLITMFVGNVPMLYFAQFMQMFAFGLFVPSSVQYVKEIIDDKNMIKGQTFITVAMTFSTILASLIGGKIIDLYGIKTILVIGGTVSVVGTLISIIFIENTKNI